MSIKQYSTKAEALREIIYEAQKTRRTKIGLKRMRAAFDKLELSADDKIEVEVALDYRDYSSRRVYAAFAVPRDNAVAS